jgi:putative acetyltransferase
MQPTTTLVEALSPLHIENVRALFLEYEASIGVDLCFQDFGQEVSSLPGNYAPPKGGLFIAFQESESVGCVGLRPLGQPSIAELKRLYVRSRARGSGLGRQLAELAISRAVEAGYERIRLDTLPNMTEAQRLYRQLGFQEISAYTFNPIPGVVYMELKLTSSGAS